MHVLADEPVSHIMKAVCTTALMSFASWRGIYRLYPRLTDSKRAYVFFVKEHFDLEICEGLGEDGFSLLTGVETEGWLELESERYVGDELCEFIPFEEVAECGEDVPRYRFMIENGSLVIQDAE